MARGGALGKRGRRVTVDGGDGDPGNQPPQLAGGLSRASQAGTPGLASHCTILPVVDIDANAEGRDLGALGRDAQAVRAGPPGGARGRRPRRGGGRHGAHPAGADGGAGDDRGQGPDVAQQHAERRAGRRSRADRGDAHLPAAHPRRARDPAPRRQGAGPAEAAGQAQPKPRKRRGGAGTGTLGGRPCGGGLGVRDLAPRHDPPRTVVPDTWRGQKPFAVAGPRDGHRATVLAAFGEAKDAPTSSASLRAQGDARKRATARASRAQDLARQLHAGG